EELPVGDAVGDGSACPSVLQRAAEPCARLSVERPIASIQARFGSTSGRGGIRTPGRRCRRQRFSRPPHSTALPPFRRRRNATHWSAGSRLACTPRRGGRVAEGTRLLSEYGDQYSIAGSNPALSAPWDACKRRADRGPLLQGRGREWRPPGR